MACARFQFHPLLRPLVHRRIEAEPLLYHFKGNPAVKDAIEACGIPHTEVDIVLINDSCATFEQAIHHGDRITVAPFGANPERADLLHLSPPIPAQARFILDVHLGRLAQRLRLLGFDCWYRTTYSDAELIAQALETDRVLLTRDRGILKHAKVRQGRLIRSSIVDDQVREVITRYHLEEQVAPFTRCSICNGLLEKVSKNEIEAQLLPGTRREHQHFMRCGQCGKLYWQGSHYHRLSAWIDSVLTTEIPGPANGESRD